MTTSGAEDLLVLHAVRLAGFAEGTTIAARTGLPIQLINETLVQLEKSHVIEQFSFADSSGWILTDAGRGYDTALLAAEVAAAGARDLLQHTSDEFEDVNAQLVRVITQWQLATPGEQQETSADTLRELSEISEELATLVQPLAEILPRFGHYAPQFAAALDKARTGDLRWVAGIGILSCHTVWAELHEDLLSSLGRDRLAQDGSAD